MNFLIYFLIALLIGSLIIGGWYNVTRGRWETLPSGGKYWTGKIFCGWQKFWEQTTGTYKIYFYGDELRKFLNDVEIRFKIAESNVMEREGSNVISGNPSMYYVHADVNKTPNAIYVSLPILERFSQKFKAIMADDIFFEAKNDNGKTLIFFYKKYKKYRFPEWVRDPLASCIYCFSSIYGSLCWWLISYVMHIVGITYPTKALLLGWPAYCFALAVVTPLIQKKS